MAVGGKIKQAPTETLHFALERCYQIYRNKLEKDNYYTLITNII